MIRCFKPVSVYVSHDGFRSTSFETVRAHEKEKTEEAIKAASDELAKELFPDNVVIPSVLIREFSKRHSLLMQKLNQLEDSDIAGSLYYSKSTEFATSDGQTHSTIQKAIDHAFKCAKTELAAVLEVALNAGNITVSNTRCKSLAGLLVNEHVAIRRALAPMHAFEIKEVPDVG